MINTDTTRRSQRLTHEEQGTYLLAATRTSDTPRADTLKFEELLHVGILSMRLFFCTSWSLVIGANAQESLLCFGLTSYYHRTV